MTELIVYEGSLPLASQAMSYWAAAAVARWFSFGMLLSSGIGTDTHAWLQRVTNLDARPFYCWRYIAPRHDSDQRTGSFVAATLVAAVLVGAVGAVGIRLAADRWQ